MQETREKGKQNRRGYAFEEAFLSKIRNQQVKLIHGSF